MKIRLKLFADFAEKMPSEQDAEGVAEITLPEGAKCVRRARSLRDSL